MTLDEIITQVSKDLCLPRRIVDRTYRAYWKAVREHIASLPLKQDLTDEEFIKLQPNVNIPSIGKLCVTLDRYKRMKKAMRIRQEKIKERDAAHQENQTDVYCNSDNRREIQEG